jgi:DNA-binding MarR family transcriptional regulator
MEARQMIPSGTTQEPSRRGELDEAELAAWRGMLRLTHRLRRDLGGELTRQYGLSMADYDVLLTLASQPDHSMRMAGLADAILQPRSTLTRLVSSLEERGLIRRDPAPGDRRGAAASLTTSGMRLFARAHRTHLAGIRRRFLDHLTHQQLEQLAGTWRTIDPTVLD